MKMLTIESSMHRYNVVIGAHIRHHLKKYISKKYSAIMIITDTNVADLYLDDIQKSLNNEEVFCSIVPNGEQSKSVDMYYRLQTEAIENGLDRHSLIIALGGGVVGDLAGFVAATFLRGIDYIQIPTTILAHDSSVGGKVAINHQLGKNLIGCFYPPQAVIYDVETLATLRYNEIRSGYAELIKEALISDEDFFHEILQIKLTNLSNETLTRHLQAGIEIKAKIVEADEKESGVRMYLNLGHTLGHALEAELGYGELTHGEAIAIGILFAIRLSEETFRVNLPFSSLYEWLVKNDYPLVLNSVTPKNLVEKMKKDKKVVNKNIKMVLLKDIGHPVVKEMDPLALQKCLKTFMEELMNI